MTAVTSPESSLQLQCQRVLSLLAARNVLAVITASNSGPVMASLRDFGLSSAISLVTGGESGKSKAESISMVRSSYAAAPGETFMVGDAISDIRAGKKVGVQTIAVNMDLKQDYWLNGKSSGPVHWDAALMQAPDTVGLAVDDSHLRPDHPGWNGGWIVVNAPECTAGEIINSIRRGNFYSSCGPQLHSLSFDGERLNVETSPVRFARLVGPGPNGVRFGGFDGEPLESLSVTVPREEWRYMYLEIEDLEGRRAWTNSLFKCIEPSPKPDEGGGK